MAQQRRTAPDGYPSNFKAILELIRFGFQMWGPARMAVLLFHVERSTGYGWQSDQHAESQAMQGIRTQDNRDWIRAPAGVGHGTYHRENAALIKDGLLRKFPRRTRRNGHAPTEFAPDWLAIRQAITEWKRTTEPAKSAPLFTEPGPIPLSHAGTRGGPRVGEPLSQPGTSPSPTVGDTVVNSDSLTEVSGSRTREPQGIAQDPPTHQQNQAIHVRSAIEAAYGKPLQPSDPIPGQVLAIAERVGVPLEALIIWIHEKGQEKRAAGYPITSPRLWATAAGTDLIPWARQNAQLVARCQRSALLAEERQAHTIHQMPDAPTPDACETTPTNWPRCPTCKQELFDAQCNNPACPDAKPARRTEAV